jgi:hypothetical protein
MKEFFGWVQASDMASIYVHLSGRDVDNALLKVYGIRNEEEKQESQIKPKTCPRCQEINQFTNVFCNKCGMMLDEDQYSHKIKNDLDRDRAETILNDVLADEDFKKLLIQKLQDANFQRWQTLKTES